MSILFLEYRSKIRNEEVTKVYVVEGSNLARRVAGSGAGDAA